MSSWPESGSDNVPELPGGEAEWETVPMAPPGAPGGMRFWLAVGSSALAGMLLIGLLGFVLLGEQASAAAAQVGQFTVITPGVATGATNGTPLAEAAAEGHAAPAFSLLDLNGKQVSLADYRGHPVWINFWASWCAPCRAEMPEMKKLYAKYKSDGLVVLGVDLGEDADTVHEFLTANGYDWNFVLDSSGGAALKYRAVGIPTHVFVDSAGVVRGYQVGGLSVPSMQSYLSRILPQ